MGKLIASYALLCFGAALWLYGYFGQRAPALSEWYDVPGWMVDYLPNLAQLGMLLMLIGAVPFFWSWRS